MSYTRRYSDSITVRGSKSESFSYPKSDTGGSRMVTVHYTETVPVSWDVNVDTNQFDKSISFANTQVNLLTGSVIATEAAQIAAQIQSSEDISNSIVDGFFGLIKSEINQQLTEIKPRVEALIIELMQHQQACAVKKKQLEDDFGRISDRYAKIFLDLDKELRNRILLLNQSAVGVHATLTTRVHRSISDISSGIATIYNKEGSNLQSMLFATGLKSRALELINSSKNYLTSEKNLSSQLQKILTANEIDKVVTRQIPVLYFESKNQSNGNDVDIISSEQILSLKENKVKLKDCFSNSDNKWKAMDLKSKEQINTFLKLELSIQENDSQNKINPKVAQQIMQLWNNDSTIQINS